MTLKDKTIVVTGKFNDFERDDIKDLLEKLGACVTSSVSKKTDLLIVGEDPGQSKLKKAESLGTPIVALSDAELNQLLAGEELAKLDMQSQTQSSTKENTASTKTEPASSETQPLTSTSSEKPKKVTKPIKDSKKAPSKKKNALTPFPEVYPPPPRNGLYQRFHSNQQLAESGQYQNGMREGTWQEFYIDGHLYREGDYNRGLKFGKWMSYFSDGKPHTNCHYDEDGKLDGYCQQWYENGILKEEGPYKHGKYFGEWKDYYPSGQLERICHINNNGRHGEYTEWHENGQIRYKGHYFFGDRVGTHQWFDEAGNLENEETHEEPATELKNLINEEPATELTNLININQNAASNLRIPEDLINDDQKLEALAKKINALMEKSDQHEILKAIDYKRDIIIFLSRLGKIDLSKYYLWLDVIGHYCSKLTDAEWIHLLKSIDASNYFVFNDRGHKYDYNPFFPPILDAYICKLYARNPDIILDAWSDYSDDIKLAIALIANRFGSNDLLPKISHVSKKIVRAYDFRNSRLKEYLFPLNGQLITFENPQTYPLHKLLLQFATEAELANASFEFLTNKMDRDASSLNLYNYRELIKYASIEELTKFLEHCTDIENIESILLEYRQDDSKTLEIIASNIPNEPDDLTKKIHYSIEASKKDRSKSMIRQLVACCAIMKQIKEQSFISDSLLDYLILSENFVELQFIDPDIYRRHPERLASSISFEYTAHQYHNAYSVDYLGYVKAPGFKLIYNTFVLLSNKQKQYVMERLWSMPDKRIRTIHFIPLMQDASWWKRAVDFIFSSESKYPISIGDAAPLGLLPTDAWPLVLENFKTYQDDPIRCKAAYYNMVTMLLQVLEKGQISDAEFDNTLLEYNLPDHYDYSSSKVRHALYKIFYTLPQERAEPIILKLMKEKKYAWRAFYFIPCHPTKSLIELAFKIYVKCKGVSEYYSNDVSAISTLKNLNMMEWVEWLYFNGKQVNPNHIERLFDEFINDCEDSETYQVIREKYEENNPSNKKERMNITPWIDDIFELADRACAESKKTQTIYLLHTLDEKTDQNCLNQIGGIPVGLNQSSWPMKNSKPMTHIFTLDLQTMPDLQARYPDARTFSLFCYNPANNEAYHPYSEDIKIVLLKNEAIENNSHFHPDNLSPLPVRYFESIAVEIPEKFPWDSFEVEDENYDELLSELHGNIYSAPARVSGHPIWLQDPEGPEELNFIMQFDETFADIYMGNRGSGVMYVFPDTAFWQVS